MSAPKMFGLMRATKCKPPSGPLTQNSFRRFRGEDGRLYHQYFDKDSEVFNTDGENWYQLKLHMPTVHRRFPHLAKLSAANKRCASRAKAGAA